VFFKTEENLFISKMSYAIFHLHFGHTEIRSRPAHAELGLKYWANVCTI
jgi:hypothetical protein